ncbi:hypothetical protein BGW36DRAFT_179222 [Talaromyces proteolyticus]|uniref:Uncharacterized protein n=1 Tax=Talaromyces proteolyticus TaxID=1131652 RepID=A0AAD4KNB7_9EURO|nr:uncharacterized protein BGW36DRAFT_179222 [Talaromyces proteolyticus]KAH8695964.1 hypothetical protein BGW36DRAFT_179222 [Talaromyces proteolyticus]
MPQEPIPIEQEKSILADVKSSGEYKEREGMPYDGTGESEVEAKDLAIEEDRAYSDSLSIIGKNIEISSISPDVALDPESVKLVQESSAGPKPQETLNQVETKYLTLEEPQKINEETPVESTVQDESTAKYFENNTLEEVEFETPAPVETMSRKISKKDKRKQKKKGKKNPDFDDEENDLAVTEETTTSEKGQGADDKVSIDVSVPNIDGEPTIREPVVTEFDAAQQGQQIAELVPAMQQPLDHKLSKKEKRKNAKKGLAEVKDNEIDDDYLAHEQNMNLVAEEYMTGEAHDTEPIEGSSADVMNIPTHVSLDPFDVSNADDELFDASVQPSYDFDMDLDTNDSQGAKQTRDAEALEKEDDLAVAADLFEEPTSTVSPNPKKSSKKQEKNKKSKAGLYEEPERVVATDETQDYENPPVEVAAKSVTIQNDEVLMRRDSKSSKAKGKKKKKRESSIALEQDETPSQTYHSTSPPTEEPAAVGQEQHYIPPNLADPAEKTVQSWPSIEFDKERTATTSDLSAKSTPSDNPVSHHAEDRDMTRHLEIREEDPENTIDDFVDKMPTDAVPESGETPLDDTWSIPVSKTRKKKKPRKQADYEDDQSHNDTQIPAPFTDLDKNIADTEPTSGPFSYPAVPQPLHEQTVLETARDLTSDDHTPSSQEMDVDVVSKMAMAAAGFDTSREVMETDSTPEDFQKVNSKRRKPKDITSIYEQKDKPNETQSYRGAFSNTDSQSSTKAGTTNKISNIFPGLERAPYRRPSPKSGTKQVNEPIVDTVPKSPSPPEPTEPRSSSLLFKPSRSTGFDHVEARVRNNTSPSLSHQSSSDSLHRTKSIHDHHSGASHGWKLDDESTPSKQSPRMLHTDNNSPPRTPLDPIREHDGPHADTPRLVMDNERYILPRPDSRSSVRSSQSLRRANRSLSSELRAAAAEHMQAARATSDEDHTDSQKHQKRSGGAGAGLAADSATGRSQPLEPAEQQIEDFADHHHNEDIPSSSTYDPVTDKGKRPVRGMSDVYRSFCDARSVTSS